MAVRENPDYLGFASASRGVMIYFGLAFSLLDTHRSQQAEELKLRAGSSPIFCGSGKEGQT